MVQLPAEIWGDIASYLSPADLQNAFACHPVFLDVYLSQQYKSFVVAPTTPSSRPGSFHPRIAAKVLQLVFREDPPMPSASSYTTSPFPIQKWNRPAYYIRHGLKIILKYLGARHTHGQRMESAYFKKLKMSIPSLQNVHSLDITITSWGMVGFDRYLPLKMQFFSEWSTCWAANLTHLSFNCNLFLIHCHWPHHLTFPNLSSLIVKLFSILEHKREILIDFLRPLIVKHSGTLATLGLIEETSRSDEPIAFLLEEEIILPKLEKLIVGKNVTFFTEHNSQQIMRFMRRCSRTLKELVCIMYNQHSYQSIYGLQREGSKSILDHDFPNLETLTLSSHIAQFSLLDNTAAITYAQRPRSRIRSLTLKTMILSRTAVVEQLFSPEALSRTFSNLTRLAFPVFCLDVELLSFFAVSLNQLEYLSIRLYRDIRGRAYHGDVRCPNNSVQVNTSEFRSALVSLQHSTTLTFFSKWKLRELDLIPYFCNTQLDPPARKALVNVLPNVHSFCNMGRQEYAEMEVDPGEEWSCKLNYFDIEQDG